jgi:predicted component of type VI protein secretion system
MAYALRFVAGKFKGGEFPLKPNREVVIGRGSEFDMVLDEDMVSRRHAKIVTYHGQIVLHDLKSTNGTFVNGEKTTMARLKVGDKVLVGQSIMEVIEATGGPAMSVDSGAGAEKATPAQAPKVARPTIIDAGPVAERPKGMSGRLSDTDITVADLVELFASNGKTGVLVLTDAVGSEGRIFFREGAVYFANVAYPDRKQVVADPLKCFYRLLTWQQGDFRMDPLSTPPDFEATIEGETRQHLTEGLRQWDELKRYSGHIPERTRKIGVTNPLEPRLSALSPEALDTLQLVLNHDLVGDVLDHSDASDLDTCLDLLYLLQNEYLSVE